MLKKVKNAIRCWWECRTKSCTYFQHYLAYGPADLTHEGYHAAEVKCAEVQKRFTAWLDAHQDDNLPVPRELDRLAAEWEKRIRA